VAADPRASARKTAAPSGKGANKKPSSSASTIRLILEVIAIWAVAHTLLIAGYRIPSGSMEPTLLVGDWLFVTPLPYGPHIPFSPWNLPAITDPKRGTIAVYQSPAQHYDPRNPIFMKDDSIPIVVKRIVAVAGDTIHMRAGMLYVNGKEQPLPFTPPPGSSTPTETNPVFAWQHRFEITGSRFGPAPVQPTHDDWGPLLVPAGHYFSLGDNRYNSIDARYYGFIPRHNFRGRPMIIYLSFDTEDLRVRWRRFFKILWNA
jgi:signal peptidase I